jgi:hypothetical protein
VIGDMAQQVGRVIGATGTSVVVTDWPGRSRVGVAVPVGRTVEGAGTAPVGLKVHLDPLWVLED